MKKVFLTLCLLALTAGFVACEPETIRENDYEQVDPDKTCPPENKDCQNGNG